MPSTSLALLAPAHDLGRGRPQAVIQFDADFKPSCMCHPPTYLNKILFGGADGTLQLWNLVSRARVYTFRGWGAAVTCVEPSPALDVIDAGLASGAVVLFNLRYDEEVMTLHNAGAAQADRGPGSEAQAAAGTAAACTCVTFRRDALSPRSGPPRREGPAQR